MKAILSGGPEDGRAIEIGGCQSEPRKIDIETDSGQMARYLRDRRHGISGVPTYRFRGYLLEHQAG